MQPVGLKGEKQQGIKQGQRQDPDEFCPGQFAEGTPEQLHAHQSNQGRREAVGQDVHGACIVQGDFSEEKREAGDERIDYC